MIKLFLTSLILIVAIGEIYNRWEIMTGLYGWKGILSFHLLCALLCVALSARFRRMVFKFKIGTTAYVPSLIVLGGSVLLSLSGHQSRSTISPTEYLFFAASITIVPIAEEIFFRGFITSLLQKAYAGVWSGYFSALIFSVAHTFPTFQRALDLKIGAPIGPFLLGLICEFIVRKTGSLAPAIAFHSACNATVIIFTMWSPGWLDKLSVFYLR